MLYFLFLSGDQTLLRLPPAAETPLPAHRFAPAAGLHAGRAQTQSLDLLAQHWQTDTLQEIKQREQEGKLRGEEKEKSSPLTPGQTLFNSPSLSSLLI